MYTTYILKLKDNSYYVGSTGDIKNRLLLHKNEKVRSTKNKLPAQLTYSENYKSRSEAQSREYQIKKWKSREAIERLIKNMASSSNG